ncbi:DUF2254 domain-containing protein [Rhodoferax sp.]|uniref:DUF2254 domain-containing protein n=1 Tax=Rhodoferax sp. TaxID=50421 RepID=UPI001A0BBB35|nr:DUF2254 domain-containing protein [Rhodoferax sp.]MBE0473602.1 DUF2254 domain-containing protein [Rhodoferax sp.]
MNALKQLWGNLRTSFWFVPFLIVAFSIALAVVLIAADSTVGDRWLARWPRLFGADAIGARAMLSTIAGSMMTVVGVTFSMTLVTLALASSQYSSRILRNFIRDRVTQVVLGIFAGIFTYCLIVLRTIRVGEEFGFVASLAVSFSIVLAIGGIGVLIYFIHHIASSIQASSIIAEVADETMDAVDRLFPGALGQAAGDDGAEQVSHAVAQHVWQTVPGIRNGYIQSVDGNALMRLACRHKTIVRMEHGIGTFLVQGTPLVSVALDSPPDDELVTSLQAAYTISRHRTPEQDCAFGIRQIVDMAMRALSPSVNDTTTAVMCVDYLAAILSRLALRDIPSPHRLVDGELRLIAVGQTFASLVSEAFNQIRGNAAGNVSILLRLLGAVQTIASMTARPLRRQVLREQVAWIAELAERTIEAPHDLERFANRLAQVIEGFETVPAVPALQG